MTTTETPARPNSTPCSPEFSRQRVAVMLAKLWNHYPQEAKSPEAWKTLTEDYLAHLSPYPVTVIERAIERGQRQPDWKFRPTIAAMIEQCDRALRDMPKPERRSEDEERKRNTLGGYTAWRRQELSKAWLNNNRALVEEAKADGWYFSLWHCVEDGANILAQTEWHQRTNPGWRPPPWHQINVDYDPVRGWSIFIAPDKLARWRSSKNAPTPIKGHAGRDFGDVMGDVVRDAEAARARAAE